MRYLLIMRSDSLKIVDKVISEEIKKRIHSLGNKIFEDKNMKKELCSECGSGNMYEGECKECGYMEEGKGMCSECGVGNMVEGECSECGYSEGEFKESKKLSKGQKYIARQAEPKDKIGANDFAKLRSKKTETKEGKKFPDLSGDGKITRKDILLGRGVKLKERNLDEKWAQEVEVKKTGEHADKSIKQIDAEIEKLLKQSDRYKDSDRKVPKRIKEKLGELYFAKRAKKGFKEKVAVDEGVTYKITLDESTNETFYFKENEVINIIENIVLEEKKKKKSKTKTLNVTKSAQTRSKKENDDYINSVVKKMKDYLKGGSKGDYEMNAKHFPKGNGELAKMSKKAYIPSDAVDDYVKNFTAAGLENLDFNDGIKPNEEWMDDLLVGSSRTGNNPEWGNSVETPVNKERNKIRKDNLLAKLKRKAYNKSSQPVNDQAGENTDKASKIMMKLESTEEKVILEDIQKIKNLISYGKKTQ